MSEFVTINKVVVEGGSTPSVKKDNIRVSDIKSFRAWHKKTGDDKDVDGDMCQLTMKPDADHDKPYTIRIAESESDFAMRLGPNVIALDDVK